MKDKIDFMDEVVNNKGISRRDALKLMGISPVAAGLLASSSTTTKAEASSAKGKIVIVGGGSGGIMATVRLNSALSNPDITLIAPNEKHIYQPGQVFVAAGEMSNEDLIKITMILFQVM